MARLVRQCMELTWAGERLVFAERPVPPPAPRGIIVKTSYAGICHSDIHFWEDETILSDGSVWRHRDIPGFQYKGVTMGHEIAGTVHSVGDEVKELAVGDRVVIYPWIGCTECACCRSGYNNLCSANRHGTTDFGQGGPQGCKNQGGYSTFVWVPDVRFAVVVPPTLDLSIAATLACGALTAYAALCTIRPAVEKLSKIYGRPWLVVFGCGGLGSWCLNLSRHVLPVTTKILAVDVSSTKVSMAAELGADETLVLPDEETDLLEQIQLKTEGGACAAIDFVGTNQTIQAAVKSLRRGGHVHCIGLFGGSLNILLGDLVLRSISITGSRTGTVQALRDLVKLVAYNKVDGPPVKCVALRDVNSALVDLKKGRVNGRAVVTFD